MRAFFFAFLLALPLGAKPVVLVSVPPQKFLVEQVGGEHFDVRLIVPSGTSPHTYDPSPQQIKSVGDAAVWFRIGEGFEERLLPLISGDVIDQREGIALLGCGCCEGGDPHLWMSPFLLRQMSQQICAVLSEAEKEKATCFEENLERFLQKLGAVEERLLQADFPQALLTLHPAFGYFCRDFAIAQLSVEKEGKEPSPKEITQLTQRIKDLDIKQILLQPQYSVRNGKRLAKQLGLETHYFDPYEEDVLTNLNVLCEVLCDCGA